MHRRHRHAIHRRGQRHALVQRVKRHGVGADVARVGAAEGEEIALAVEGQLGPGREVAPPVVGHERLAPLGRPLHRASDSPRRPRDQRELGIAAVAGPEVTADVARHHAHRALGDTERAGHRGLRAAETARTGVYSVTAGRGVPDADRRARFHRHARDPVHPSVQSHHVRGARERAIDAGGIADVGVETHVRRGPVVEEGRIGPSGRRAGGHGGQRRPRDLDTLGAVSRRGGRLGDDHGHHLADEAHAVSRHRRMGRDEGHVAAPQHVLVRVAGHRTVRERLDPVGSGIGAGQHRDHARGCESRGNVHAADAGVGVRGAHEARVSLTRHVDVVAVAASADEQARVLLAQDRLAEALARRTGSRLEKRHVALDRCSAPRRCQGLTVPPFRRIVRASGKRMASRMSPNAGAAR